jgi:hypothetical protein
MGDDNRFFRWLGRINAMLFFLAAAGVIVVAGGNALIWGLYTREAPPPGAEAKNGGDTYAFGGTIGGPSVVTGAPSITHLNGTDEGVMVLQRGGPRGSGLDSVPRADANDVNFLLIDLKTMKTHWLFDGVKRDIGEVFEVRSSVPMQQNSPDSVTALLMTVAAADTNGDGKITQADDHALYGYRVGNAKAVKLLDAKSVSGMEQIDSDRIVISYYDGKADHALLLSAKTFAPIGDTALSPTPN